jgi:bacillithiol biosynthesis cysteine-adding enzyme BshC
VAEVARRLDPIVHGVLVAQNAALPPSAARDAHLAQLASGAACVVTGQQVGLFLGPLYTIYKAASAIVLARELARETGTPVVPVFWLQTEDHDLLEIASCSVRGRHDVETIAVRVDASNKISIAHVALPPEIDACVDALAQLVGDGEHATAHVASVRRHYRSGATWGASFAGVLAELFAPEGLVVIDPRVPELAAAIAPVHARALENSEHIAAALDARSRELEIAGSAPGIHVRPGAPLAFFHPDGARGPRVRLEGVTGDRFREVGGDRSHTRAELLAALARDPMVFSTSALLRPLVQDTLLPTAAYVGGPAEVTYYAQLEPLYRAFDRPPPLAVPRCRFRIVDERARALLARLGLSPDDAARSEAELVAQLAKPQLADVEARLLAPFLAAHAELAARAEPTLATAFAKTRASVERSIGKLTSAIERDAGYRDAELVAAVRRLRSWLVPNGEPQERVLGISGFAARIGDRDLVERVLAAVEPCDSTLRELS